MLAVPVPPGLGSPSVPGGPFLGPCVSWITGADVAACCSAASGVGSNTGLLDNAAYEASMALYEISGRQFAGGCERVVRPQRDPCQCWGPSSLGLGPWFWTASGWGAATWGWWNEFGDRRGCNPLSRVRLAGYPVTSIVEVKIDGTVLPPLDANGNPNYRLDKWRDLVRMADPGPPFQQRLWPSCQYADLDDTQPGTFSIDYLWGVDPPQLGRDAACEIACQLYAAFSGADCQLPAGVTQVTRQGVTVQRGLLANWFDPTKPTGLVHVDLFLKSYWRTRAGRRPAVFSPDVAGFAREVGS